MLATTALCALIVQGCNGCTGPGLLPGTPPIHSVEFPRPVRLSAFVTPVDTPSQAWRPAVRFTNTGSSTAEVDHGACSVAIWIYPAAAQSGAPVWDNRLPANACIEILYRRQLPPGGTYDLPAEILSRSGALASLPPGKYKVFVAVRPGIGEHTPLRVLPAGEIALAP